MEPGRTTPRSKFYAIKYHWFRSWLKPKVNEIQYIETSSQKADAMQRWAKRGQKHRQGRQGRGTAGEMSRCVSDGQ
jgi:hypothetical protein